MSKVTAKERAGEPAYQRHTEQEKQHSLSTPYIYKALSSPDRYRVVYIEPGNYGEDIWFSLKEFEGNDADHYHAISYTWESTELTHVIYSPNGSLRLTTNLHNAIQRFRQSDRPIYLWADAICICQDDLHERASQVLLISRIFLQSQVVQIWLGEELNTDKQAFELVENMVDIYDSGIESASTTIDVDVLHVLYNAAASKSLTALLERSWFSRTWTFQEVYCAKVVTLCCGSLYMNFDRLKALASILSQYSGTAFLESTLAIDNLMQLSLIPENTSPYASIDQSNEFVDLIADCRLRNCTVAHDKIYGFLGLTNYSTTLSYAPDYTVPFTRLYRDFAMHTIIATQSLDIFKHCTAAEAEICQPTWVPDWRVQKRHLDWVDSHSGDVYRACCDHNAIVTPSENLEELIVMGFTFDNVSHMSKCVEGDRWEPPPFNADPERGLVLRFGLQHEVVQQFFALASQTRGYLEGNSPQEALYRALVADRLADIGRIPSDIIAEIQKFTQFLAEIDLKGPDNVDENLESDNFYDIERSFITTCRYRRSCLTRKGMIGWVPQAAEEGDLVSILFGSSTPVLLRPMGGSFRMLGQCYLHGIMDGEAMTEENLAQVRQFTLI